jgi:protein SDA1
MEGRKDRAEFGGRKGKVSEFASTSNKQKEKKKNFMMLKHKLKFKAKRSFVDKQKTLRKSMIKSQKYK